MLDNNHVAENSDFVTYDDSLGDEHLTLASLITQELFSFTGNQREIFDATVSHLLYTDYIIMNPITSNIEMGSNKGSLPSGTGFTGWFGYVLNKLFNYYGKISLYGYEYVNKMFNIYTKAGTFDHVGLGDDSLS